MNNKGRWNKERLAEQLKFFGAKKLGFISCYAKKPRILMTNTKKADDMLLSIGRKQAISRQAVVDAGRMALYQQQTQMGMQNSQMGYMQMANMNMQQSGLGQAFCGGLGDLAGMNGLIGNIGGRAL